MTGLAQAVGTHGVARWTWDLKTVNAKGLDVRLRLPQGFDSIEADVRRLIGVRLTRGTCHAGLTVARAAPIARPRIDTHLLAELLKSLAEVPLPSGVGPASLDGLLSVRGVVETVEDEPDAEETAALHAACRDGLAEALDALVAMREGEGAALDVVLRERLQTIADLTRKADVAPQRRPEAAMEKLTRAVEALQARFALDGERLYQEAVLIAAKADVREELDRLATHVAAARELLGQGGPIGRRLDFLAQELGREATTFCAKVNDAALTAIGLELRVEIEQFREQVQNIE